MTRNQLLDLLWQESLVFVEREQFVEGLEGWDLDHIEQNGRTAVVFTVKGPEFHFTVVDPDFQCTREILRRYPGELIAAHGYALTKTPKEDQRQLRFNRRLGFYPVGEDEHFVHLRIDKLRGE